MSRTGFDALSTVFMDATDPILIEDLQGHVIDLNREAERVYQWSRDELVGSPIKRIVPPKRHAQADDLLHRCRKGEEVRNVQGLRVSKDGTIHDVLLTVSLLRDEGGEAVAIATFAKDITALRQAEEALRRHGEELETRVRERTQELESALSQLGSVNAKLERELALARERAEATRRDDESVLLGESIAVRALREGIAAQAPNHAPLLLLGPIGAGQAAVARAIHYGSSRQDAPFLNIDCHYAIAEAGEDSLFSRSAKEQSKLELAEGGTLYLEAVTALGPRGQTLLLEYLKDAEVTEDASSQTSKTIPDVRIVAYSSHDLSQDVAARRFNPALAEILGHQRLSIPSLGERREDLRSLAEHIVTRRAQSIGKIVDGIEETSVKQIESYGWPGNFSELRAVLERSTMLARGRRVEVDESLLHEGPRLGGYRLTEPLGHGGMGEVWRGEHNLLARPAAIKLIRDEMNEGDADALEETKARFKREAQITARLRSPHTVELYDFGVNEKGDFYYVMELLEGEDLHTLVVEHGPLTPDRTVYLLRQACLSLAEAHEANLIHRDIKPANLFVARLGTQYDQLKVLDFGIVKTLGKSRTHLTSTGVITGTPGYLAPERVVGKKDPDARSDLYALGCVAYWMLTGQEVFSETTAMALVLMHVQDPPPPISNYCDLPPELATTIMSCLEKEPAKRPQSASALRTMLGRVPLKKVWSNKRAESWWREHHPLGGSSTGKDPQIGMAATLFESAPSPIKKP